MDTFERFYEDHIEEVICYLTNEFQQASLERNFKRMTSCIFLGIYKIYIKDQTVDLVNLLEKHKKSYGYGYFYEKDETFEYGAEVGMMISLDKTTQDMFQFKLLDKDVGYITCNKEMLDFWNSE